MRKLKTDDMQRKIDASVTKRGEKAARAYLDAKAQAPAWCWKEVVATIAFIIALIGIVGVLLAM